MHPLDCVPFKKFEYFFQALPKEIQKRNFHSCLRAILVFLTDVVRASLRHYLLPRLCLLMNDSE